MPELDCQSQRIVFAGTPEFAAIALDALLASSHRVVGVLTQPDRPAGRGRKLTASAVKERALAAGLECQQPVSLKGEEALAALASLAPDVLVVAAYGLLLPKAVLELPRRGCLNIHASLLPRWRGAAPIQRAILAGDDETGVAIMQMDEGLDTGPVLLEKRIAITRDDTAASLHDRLAQLGAEALIEALPAHCDGSLVPMPQALEGVSYADKFSKADAAVDFRDDAASIHRQIRAFNPFPVAHAPLGDRTVRLWRSRLPEHGSLLDAVDSAPPGTVVACLADGALLVRTGGGSLPFLELLELQWPGKPVQSAADFARGRSLVGQRFG